MSRSEAAPGKGRILIAVAMLLCLGARSVARAQGGSPGVAALTERPRRMAEPTVAVDPANPRRIVAGADPYLGPVRIVVVSSTDRGATWGNRTQILPPGFAKSYDPNLAFDAEGQAIVVGGASQGGRARCQPGSAIFMATFTASGLRYAMVQAPRPGVYVDRPRMVAQDGTAYITWTESSGTGSECRGSPLRSSIMFTRSGSGGSFDPPVALPSSGLPAPFGSSMAITGATLSIAVGERNPGRLERVVVVTSQDRGASFGVPETVAEGPPVPPSIPGLGGFVSAVPAIATRPDGAQAVVWTALDAGVSGLRMAHRAASGGWQQAAPPAGESGTFQLFPGVAYDRSGAIWLVNASYKDGVLRFLRRYFNGSWSPPEELASGPAGRYQEVGQFMGISSERSTIAIAVPVDSAQASMLLVAVTQGFDPPPPPKPSPGGSSQPGARSRTRSPLAEVAFLLLGLGLLRLLIRAVGSRRRRSARSSREGRRQLP